MAPATQTTTASPAEITTKNGLPLILAITRALVYYQPNLATVTALVSTRSANTLILGAPALHAHRLVITATATTNMTAIPAPLATTSLIPPPSAAVSSALMATAHNIPAIHDDACPDAHLITTINKLKAMSMLIFGVGPLGAASLSMALGTIIDCITLISAIFVTITVSNAEAPTKTNAVPANATTTCGHNTQIIVHRVAPEEAMLQQTGQDNTSTKTMSTWERALAIGPAISVTPIADGAGILHPGAYNAKMVTI